MEPTPETALETRELSIRFGGHVAVDAVSCRFESDVLTAVVGPNGAGKTTFFNLISGKLRASAGRVYLFGEDVTALKAPKRAQKGMGRAFQLTNLFPGLTVLENMRLAVAARASTPLQLFRRADTQAATYRQAHEWLDRVGLGARAQAPALALSHGDQRKLEVGLLLALEPRVFIFDEPTSGMSVDEVPAVLDLIQEVKRGHGNTVLLVEHKMDVIHALADRIVVLHHGRIVADGAPGEVMASSVVEEAYLGTGGGGEKRAPNHDG